MTTTVTEAKPQVLYRMFDEAGELLYVGISASPIARFQQHRADSPWWTDARTITLEHFEDRDAVLTAEREAIQAEAPIHNVHRGMVTRTFYVQSELWAAAKTLAEEQGSNISAVLREFLEAYVKKGGKR